MGPGRHPASQQPTDAAELRQTQVQASQPCRTFHQSPEAHRRVATRYDKSARNYLAFTHLAAALTLLNVTVNTT
ncbi:MAG: hypothetical protein C0483_24235 [Pirellula sp.]|nr:hypothetical protein [Pirellula sp.]